MNIGPQIRVEGRWYVAVVDRENSSGAILIPVACWCVVDGAIVPFVADPSKENDRLVASSEYEDDLLAIVPPGEEVNGPWDEIANELLAGERGEGDRPS